MTVYSGVYDNPAPAGAGLHVQINETWKVLLCVYKG